MERFNRLDVNENLQQSEVRTYFSEVSLTLNAIAESNRLEAVDAILEKLAEILNLQNNASCSAIFTETFRFLRNFVAGSVDHQTAVILNQTLFELTISHINRLTSCLNKDIFFESDLLQLKCAVQFLGNLVTNNSNAKQIVWMKTRSLFKIWLESNDVTLRKYSAMLFYNCMLGVSVHRDEFLQSFPDGIAIIQLLLNCTMKDECEWGLYAIENLLESTTFMENIYLSLPLDSRLPFLDILCEKISSQKSVIGRVPHEMFLFVAQQFETKADIILKTGEKMPDVNDIMEPLEVVRFLEVLCLASTKPSYQSYLQESSSLLVSTIFLLKSIHLAGKEATNFFTSVEKLSLTKPADSSEMLDHPADGFKKNLIRLIANLCWKHKVNQDRVRDMDGISLLLDCCKLDARNPFIIQWVVFAIRNLCEGNLENQQLISDMELLGTVDSAVLSEVGIKMELNDQHEKPVLQAASATTRTREDTAKEDILDLMS